MSIFQPPSENIHLFGEEAMRAYQEKRKPNYNIEELKNRKKSKEISINNQYGLFHALPPPSRQRPTHSPPPRLLLSSLPPPPPPSSPINQSYQLPLSHVIDIQYYSDPDEKETLSPKLHKQKSYSSNTSTTNLINKYSNKYSPNLYDSRYNITDPLTNNRCNCYIL